MKMHLPIITLAALTLSSAAYAGSASASRAPEPLAMSSSSHPSGDHDRTLALLNANRTVRTRAAGPVVTASHPSGDHDRNLLQRLSLRSLLGKSSQTTTSSHHSGDHDGRNPGRFAQTKHRPGCLLAVQTKTGSRPCDCRAS
jgi:hypothetical protein